MDKAKEIWDENARPALAKTGKLTKKSLVIGGKYVIVGAKEGGKAGLVVARLLNLPVLVCFAAGLFLRRKKHIDAAEKKWNIDLSKLDATSVHLLSPAQLDALRAELPRWVSDGDYERAAWLNTAIEQMWPGVDAVRFQLIARAVASPAPAHSPPTPTPRPPPNSPRSSSATSSTAPSGRSSRRSAPTSARRR